jgi:hypothetical protein
MNRIERPTAANWAFICPSVPLSVSDIEQYPHQEKEGAKK